jgi:hypothetical protein
MSIIFSINSFNENIILQHVSENTLNSSKEISSTFIHNDLSESCLTEHPKSPTAKSLIASLVNTSLRKDKEFRSPNCTEKRKLKVWVRKQLQFQGNLIARKQSTKKSHANILKP